MSVLIKGMEMPKDGVYWCEIDVAGDIATITIHGEERKSFHLVPIPAHGRLIDADALCDGLVSNHPVVIHAKNAPTIIPASEDVSHQQVTAKWYKPTGMMPPEFAGRHRCSACDGFAMHDWKHHREQLTPFCSHCGAIMENGDSEL